MKQVVVSMIVVMIAAGILAGMVIYSVSVMRQVQIGILTGEITSIAEPVEGRLLPLATD